MGVLKKVLDYSVWAIFFGISIFVVLFLASANAVPGDALFGTKLGLEKVIIASSKILNNQVDAQMSFLSNRLHETTKTINTPYASASFKRLDDQVDTTATTISMISDPVERKQAAQKYVAQLTDVSTILSQEKQKYVSTTTSYAPTSTSNTITASKDNSLTPTPTPSQTTSSSSNSIATQIDTTQANVTQTIEQMTQIQYADTNTVTTPTETPTSVPTDVPTVAPIKTQNTAPIVIPTTVATIVPTTAPIDTPTTAPKATLPPDLNKYNKDN